MRKWIKKGGNGALWLLAATLLTKLIGVLQKIPLQNLGGDTVFGLYNMVYPLYQLMLTLAVSGIPTVISIMLAEGNSGHREQFARASNRFMLLFGFVLAAVLYSVSRPMSNLLGSSELALMVQIVAVTLCITPLLASYRGYFQAIKLASYSSISQLIEQLVRVTIMVGILYIGLQQDWTDIAVATHVMWGGIVGSLLAVIYLFTAKNKLFKVHDDHDKASTRMTRSIVKIFVKQGIPATLAAVIVPLLAVIDSFTVPRLLGMTLSFSDITEQFGLYSRIQPLVQLVTMLLAATIAGAIPSIVEHNKHNFEHESKKKYINTLMLYTFIIGSAASVGLFILAEPICMMLYNNTDGVGWFKLLAFMTLPASLLAVYTPVLLLERKYKRLLILVIMSVTLKLILNVLYVEQTGSMQGAVYATLITLYSVMMVAMYKPVRKEKQSAPGFSKLNKAIFSLVVMVGSLICLRLVFERLLHMTFEQRLVATLYTIALVGIGAIVLAMVLIKLKLLSKQEIKQLLK